MHPVLSIFKVMKKVRTFQESFVRIMMQFIGTVLGTAAVVLIAKDNASIMDATLGMVNYSDSM
jgi:glycerol uptake facilitator-like aquaporin